MKIDLWFILGACVILILAIFFYFNKKYIASKLMKMFLKYRKEKVQVPVIRIEYVPKSVSTVSRFHLGRIHEIPEAYNVYYVYGYNNHVFNNKELYDRVKNGEKSFEIFVCKGYNKRNKLKHIYHTIAS